MSDHWASIPRVNHCEVLVYLLDIVHVWINIYLCVYVYFFSIFTQMIAHYTHYSTLYFSPCGMSER